jgi:hypothetical protein
VQARPEASSRDLAIFAGSVLAFALVLSAIAWSLPRVNYNPSDALSAIGATSVILSARGASWGRRLAYGSLALAGFVAVDATFLMSGAMHWAFTGLSEGDRSGSVAAVAFLFFAQIFPLAVLVVFAGRNPSILWLPAQHTKQPKRTRQLKRVARGKRGRR